MLKHPKSFYQSVFIFICLLYVVYGLDNGLARTPAMGWNSWNRFLCNINETLIRQTADILVSTGLAAKGYKYVNIDDCWQIDRNVTTKEIIEDKTKFPSGMAALGQYIHSKGLLYGLYSDAGYKTCQGRPGSLGYETQDANTYAKWKVDYLKYDNCNNDGTPSKKRYPVMRDALNASGRPIYFSMCQWGLANVSEWAAPVGNSWRTTGDIGNYYDSMIDILDKQVGLAKYAGPGGWNDPDMLQVGNRNMTHDQQQTHFAMWAALKSPLLIGCSLKEMTQFTLEILGNEEVIAINQDSLGVQAQRLYVEKSTQFHRQVWGGQLSGQRYVLICLNRDTKLTKCTIDFERIFKSKRVTYIRQVIDQVDIHLPADKMFKTKSIRGHSVAMYVLNLSN